MSVAPEPRTRADKRLHQPGLDAVASSRRCDCSTATLSSPAGDIVVLRVAGEVDPSSVAVLGAALDEVLDRRPDHLVIDLTALVSCSSRCFTLIADATRVGPARGVRCSISAASPLTARLGPHHWPQGDGPQIHRTTAAAVLSAVVLAADLWKPARSVVGWRPGGVAPPPARPSRRTAPTERRECRAPARRRRRRHRRRSLPAASERPRRRRRGSRGRRPGRRPAVVPRCSGCGGSRCELR